MAIADRLRAAREARPAGEMPFLDHLEELRWRILWSLVALVVGAIAGFFIVLRFNVMWVLLEPVRRAFEDPDLRLIALSPADTFWVTMRLGIAVGVLLTLPIVVYHIWRFLSPALEKHEKRAIIPALYLGLVLFCAGVAMAYFLALPLTLEFFQILQEDFVEHQLEVSKTLGFITTLLLVFGVIFELPVVIMVLTAVGLVTPDFLRSKRRHAIVLITIAASLISPGDVITLTIMMMVPLILLYEMGIHLSAGIFRRKLKRQAEWERQTSPSAEPPPGSVEADR
jgi:sec-independent protein translocase protein TatC